MLRSNLIAIIGLVILSGCASNDAGQEFYDPYETQNRAAHDLNVKLDKVVLKPLAQVYTDVTPDPLEKAASNFASNLSRPADVVNYVLQGNIDQAATSTGNFILNTIFGFGGLVDLAGTSNMMARNTDFGETLAVWGLREGAYVEAPFLGPTTERGMLGKVVDFAIDPVSSLLNAPLSQVRRAASVGEVLTDRIQYDETIYGLLYGSADSYAQTRLYYLQNRRYVLGQTPVKTADPFEELYGNGN